VNLELPGQEEDTVEPTMQAPQMHKMTFKRAACGVVWSVYTLLATMFALSLAVSGPINAVLFVLVIAFFCGWYAYRIWTFQAKRLVFLVVF